MSEEKHDSDNPKKAFGTADASDPDYGDLGIDPTEHEGIDAEPMGLEAHNKMVEKAESLEKRWEEEFYPAFPPKKTERQLKQLAERKRKKIWLQAFNASAGIDVVACLYAGIETKAYKKWIKDDPDFAEQYEETKLKIVGRLQMILNMRTGMCKRIIKMDDRKLSDHLIAFQIKKLMPDTYDNKGNGNLTLKLEIPRPEWGDNNSIPPVPPPAGIP